MFGMGTGGSLRLLSPEIVCAFHSLRRFLRAFASRAPSKLHRSRVGSARFRFTSLRFRFCFSLSPLRFRSLLRFPSRNSRHFSFADPQSSLPLSASWLSDQALGRLVSPSFTRYRASTDDLSTWSSPRGLTRFRDGNSLLWVGFTLRCLQRLSSPHFASQLCRWHDNCCTRGASIPVLSY